MGEIVIHIPADFAVDEAMQFRQNTYELLERGEKNFILDFSKCSFIDSTGLGVLVSTLKKCMEVNGSLKVNSVNDPNVLRVFKLARLGKVFSLE